MGLGIGLRAMFAALFDRKAAERIRQALEGSTAPAITATAQAPAAEPKRERTPKVSPRNDAVSLLAALQREARLVDLFQEDLANYSDAQVGAAARPCLQQCQATLKRLIQIQPINDSGEGSTIDVGTDASPARYQWVGTEGSGSEAVSTSGKLIHQGWRAAKIQLPAWTGNSDDVDVIAPAQIQR